MVGVNTPLDASLYFTKTEVQAFKRAFDKTDTVTIAARTGATLPTEYNAACGNTPPYTLNNYGDFNALFADAEIDKDDVIANGYEIQIEYEAKQSPDLAFQVAPYIGATALTVSGRLTTSWAPYSVTYAFLNITRTDDFIPKITASGGFEGNGTVYIKNVVIKLRNIKTSTTLVIKP